MNKKLLSILVSIIVGITMTFGSVAIAFAAEEGTPMVSKVGMLWAKSLGGYGSGSYSTSPVYDNGYVYSVSGNTLLKLDAASGEEIAATPINGTIGFGTIPVTVADGKVFIPLDGSAVSIVDADTMKELRVVKYAAGETGYQTISPITYDNGSIYVGSWKKKAGGTFAKIDLDSYTATELIKDDNGFYWAGAYVDGTKVIVGTNSQATDTSDDVVPVSGKANVYFIDLEQTYEDISAIEPAIQVDGSVCSGIVKSQDKYYFSTKGAKLYECSMTVDGVLTIDREIALAGASTCTPLIDDGKIYVGNTNGVTVINQTTGEAEQNVKTPADAKFLTVMGGKVYCTYNKVPGGIYNVTAGTDYFVPSTDMQNYCISSIAVNDTTMYYRNDSGYLMAVGKLKSIEGCQITLQAGQFTYTGGQITPDVTSVVLDGETLVAGTDYVVSYANNIHAGTATAVVTGTGKYAGTASVDFTIGKGEQVISAANVSKTISSSASSLNAKATGALSYRSSNTAVATVSASGVVTPRNYGIITITINAAATSDVNAATKSITVSITPKAPSGVKVSAGKKKMAVKWKKDKNATGYRIAYTTDPNFRSGVVYANIAKFKTVKKVVKSLAKGKYYYVKVQEYKTVGGTKIYGPFSGAKKVKIK